VVRDGAGVRMSAVLVVPGDSLVVQAGDVVAADGELVEAHGLQVNESAITGESMPRRREVGDTLEAGTVVTRGRGLAEVTRTGPSSGLGRIAALVAAAPVRATPLQQRLTRLSAQLVVGVLALAALVLVLGVLRGRPVTDMIVVALSLAVAAVPESLPAVVAISLAMGAHRMARRNALVRRLPAVETLGSVTVLASDKTGTLTEGRMTVQGVWAPGQDDTQHAVSRPLSEPHAELLVDALLCNDAQVVVDDDGDTHTAGDPVDQALLKMAGDQGLDVGTHRSSWTRTAELPFDASTRRMVTVHRNEQLGTWLVVCKGAPESVLELVDGAAQEDVRRATERLAGRGQRVLLVAARSHDGPLGVDDAVGLRVVGLLGLSDPPRESARKVSRDLRAAGVRMVLVTGDHGVTARTVAEHLGLLTGADSVVEGDDLSEELRDNDASRVGVYARIRPEQKLDIVRHLQANGEVVAMVGDGVNDAPALRVADIGVAMGESGTEVARQAADLVLADDDLDTVLHAVEEGRRIYANIRKFLRYGLAGGLAEVLVMIVGPFVGLAVPLVPAQILWINMLTHGLPGVAFGAEPIDPSAMRQPPRSPQQSILGGGLLRQIAFAGTCIAVVSLLAGFLAPGLDVQTQTGVFVTLGLGQLSVAWALRARVARRRLRDRAVEAAVLGAVAFQLLGVYVPLLNELLRTQPVPLPALGVLAALGALPGLGVRLTRVVAARRPRTADATSAAP
jgi:Ca2+-transporting ATPase